MHETVCAQLGSCARSLVFALAGCHAQYTRADRGDGCVRPRAQRHRRTPLDVARGRVQRRPARSRRSSASSARSALDVGKGTLELTFDTELATPGLHIDRGLAGEAGQLADLWRLRAAGDRHAARGRRSAARSRREADRGQRQRLFGDELELARCASRRGAAGSMRASCFAASTPQRLTRRRRS